MENLTENEFTNSALDATVEEGAPPLPGLVAVRRMRAATKALSRAIEDLRAERYVAGAAVGALIAAVAGQDFPMVEDTPEWKTAWSKLVRAGTPGPDGNPTFIVDVAIAAKFKDDALLAIELAIAALQAGELSAVALFKSGQRLPGSWGNLPVIDLAQKVTERATQYYRGRLFE